MKRRFIAIALSLALAAPLAGHADILTVQAETAGEPGQDQGSDSDSDSDADSDDTDKDSDKNSKEEGKDSNKNSEDDGKDDADDDQSDKDQDSGKDAKNTDKDQDAKDKDSDSTDSGKDTNKTKDSDSDTADKTKDGKDAATKEFDVEIQQTNALNGISLLSNDADDLTPAADDSGLVVPETPELEGPAYTIYYYLNKANAGVQSIANGERSSTEFEIPLNEEEGKLLNDLYEKSVAEDSNEFHTYVKKAIYGLYYEHPEYFYWWNDSFTCYPMYSATGEYEPYLVLGLDVGTDFCVDGNVNVLDSAQVTAAQKAMQNAAAIVENADNMGLYEALTFFKERICGLVTYQKNAGKTVAGPYNMVYVFDLDPNTNVVCEGYSKAFKYLFELWAARHPDKAGEFKCYLVDGVSVHETPEKDGPHMWNIVYNPTGYSNYVVDVTNCDEGEDGYPDHLFMKNPTKITTGTWAGIEDRTIGYVLDCGTYDYGHFELTYSYYTDRVKNTTDTLRGYSDYQTNVNMDMYQDPSELDGAD